MARRKNAPESVKIKHGLAERLREVRTELYGERGGPDLARRLEIPIRTWYNYETGVTVPAEIILRIVELTLVEPIWLLRGEGPKFRAKATEINGEIPASLSQAPVPTLLRAALYRLEQAERSPSRSMAPKPMAAATNGDAADHDADGEFADLPLIGADRMASGPLTPSDGPSYRLARREWQASRHLRVGDDQMAPIVAEGAIVAFTKAEPATEAFDGKLIVTTVDGREVVRWFQFSGRYALLRAENPAADPASILVDLSDSDAPAYHRVLWISTPHGGASGR